ncbi:MAG: hypothetical protein A2386_07000 [Elusimicrobia bacterium RIFOXYB1_FULL_48_9]|nr:MAG: hypothetical protein A2386_07000 [Elusimicrobia bacterium RIFOXYB1_FULL_48_9]
MDVIDIKGSVFLKSGEDTRLLAGHLWVFSNEISHIKGEIAAGDLCELFDSRGSFIGIGFYNPKSLIAFRLLSKEKIAVNSDFFAKKITEALEFRKTVYPGARSLRVVFGESDFLPGLIIDKYEDYLSVQAVSAGMDKNMGLLVEAMVRVLAPKGIIARNDSSLRAFEGLKESVDILQGDVPENIPIDENGCSFSVNLRSGQKTGFFFDQRENRVLLSKYSRGKSVLDCHCHTGAFSVYALKGGAKSVVALDSSKPALEKAAENARLNSFGGAFEAVNADALEYLEEQKKSQTKFDIIVLDPPALIKSRKHQKAGYRMYKKLNAAAISALKSGGILATSSCSHNLSQQDFMLMLKDAAGSARRQALVLERGFQSKDHPVLVAMNESEYLKFAMLKVI